MGENAVGQNSQALTNPLGKMLRINPDGSIPTDNPFYTQTTGINRAIWALGLRNPFTFAFQPTSRPDVHQRRGSGHVGGDQRRRTRRQLRVAEHRRAKQPALHRARVHFMATVRARVWAARLPAGRSTAGLPAQFPAEYVGDYFFADYCSGWINRLDETGGQITITTFASGIPSPVDLAVGPEGNLYYLARGSGSVYRINFTGGQAPAITLQPASQTVSVGQSATFNVTASGTAPLSYQWQRNSVNISGATSASYTLSSTTLSDNGAQFRAIVTNAAGSATSNAATLTVVANQPPVPTINVPAAGTLYTAGTTLTYSGIGHRS